MRVSKKEEKKSAHIAHKPSKWRYVYGCNAIYAHLCTGGGDTYFSCVPFTQNVHYNITESTNNWDFFFLWLLLLLLDFRVFWPYFCFLSSSVLFFNVGCCLLFRLQVYFVACFHTFLFFNSNIRTHWNAFYKRALTNQLAYFLLLFFFNFLSFTFRFDVMLYMRLCVHYFSWHFWKFIVSFSLHILCVQSTMLQTYFCNNNIYIFMSLKWTTQRRLIYTRLYSEIDIYTFIHVYTTTDLAIKHHKSTQETIFLCTCLRNYY